MWTNQIQNIQSSENAGRDSFGERGSEAIEEAIPQKVHQIDSSMLGRIFADGRRYWIEHTIENLKIRWEYDLFL